MRLVLAVTIDIEPGAQEISVEAVETCVRAQLEPCTVPGSTVTDVRCIREEAT